MSNYYGKSYLDTDSFIKHCQECLFLKKEQLDSDLLSFLDKNNIFKPIVRVSFSTAYIDYIDDIRNNPNNPYYNTEYYEIPEKWTKIHILCEEIKNGLSFSYFHILDKNRNKYKKYILKDISNKSTINFRTKTKCFKNYYSYWQVYEINEVLEKYTISIIANYSAASIKRLLNNYRLSKREVYKILSIHEYSYYYFHLKSNQQNFEALSFFVQSFRKYDNSQKLEISDKLNKSIITYSESDVNNRERFLKCLSKIILNKYNLSFEKSVEFLRYLCDLYYFYEEKNNKSLSCLLIQDIGYLIIFIRKTFNKNYEEVKNIIGYKNSKYLILDEIFPNELNRAKERTKQVLKSYENNNDLKVALKAIAVNIILADKDIDDLLSFMEEKNLDLFFYQIKQLNIDWFSNNPNVNTRLNQHIVIISLLFENLVKIIATNNDKDLKKSINNLFDSSTGWCQQLSNNYDQFTKFTTKDNVKQCIDNINAIDIKLNTCEQTIIKIILKAVFARNISAHAQFKYYEIDREEYFELINSVLFGIIFTWKYSCHNNKLMQNTENKDNA